MSLSTTIVLGVALAQPAHPGPKLPSDGEVRQMLKVMDNFDDGPDILMKHGASMFPAYSGILASKNYTEGQLSCIFWIVKHIEADRSQFLEDAVTALAHTDVNVRRSALGLLTQIGSARDAAPIAALLADPEITVVYRAAKALEGIGDRRALTALDVWLVCGQGREVPELLEAVTKSRDALRRRLDSPVPIAPPPRAIIRK
jgi:hypothetical protein